MKRFAACIDIQARPEAVWRVLADIPGWAGWDPNTDQAEGAAQRDAQLSFVFTYAPGRTVKVKVTAIDEPFLLEWTGGDEQLTGVRTHRVTPAGAGSLVEVSQAFSGCAVNNVHLPQLDIAFDGFCAALKERVESGASRKAVKPAPPAQDWRIDFNRRMREDRDRVLHMVRRFEASPERVYDAWTDPHYASLWLFTGPTSATHTCHMDPRPGGRWAITDTREGVTYTATGEFLEADRPRRVSLTFAMPQFSDQHDLITVTFEADGEGCIMRFRQEGIAQEAKAPSKSGWTPMFEGLAAAIGAPAPQIL